MGNDEHSQNVYKSAHEQGLDPLEYCDRMEELFQKTWRSLDLSYDYFIRTTEPNHKAGVRELVQRVYAAGDIYEGVYEGWYLRRMRGIQTREGAGRRTMPAASAERAAVDQRKELLLQTVEVPEAAARSLYDQPLDFPSPRRAGTNSSALLEAAWKTFRSAAQGSRGAFRCRGIPRASSMCGSTPLINYASAVGLGTDPQRLEKWWPADVHLIGKDITRFHTVIWPAMLMRRSSRCRARSSRTAS
jgi:methionyl-tRNA synthetase